MVAYESAPSSAEGTRPLPGYNVPVFALVIALGGLTLVSVLSPQSTDLAHSLLLNTAITTAALIIAIVAAYFALAEFFLYGAVASLLVGLAFLLLADANLGSGLVPVLAGWHDRISSAETAWGVQRCAGAATLLVAAVARTRVVSKPARGKWVLISIAAASVFAIVITLWVYIAGNGRPPSEIEGPTQFAAAFCFFVAGVLFWQAGKNTGRAWFIWLALNCIVGGFAQLQYVSSPSVPSSVQVGDVLRLVFFSGILFALVAEGRRGYRVLRSQTSELEVLHGLMTAPIVQNTEEVVRHVARTVGEALLCSAHVVVEPGGAPSESDDSAPEVVRVVESDELDVGLAVALKARGRRLGTLVVSRSGRNPFSPHDERLLRSFAAQASILVDRSLLYEEVAAGAVIEERSRLAREIHDGLAQHLAFLKMRVAWLKRSPATVDASQLEDIEGVLGTALTEARHAITTLRSVSESTTSSDAVVNYAEEFARISGLAIAIERDDDVPEAGPRASAELLRIVQEALNNVRKHAEASAVRVELQGRDGGISVRILDDGNGLVPAEGREFHFGTQIMRERAESVGGSLSIISTPGVGTEVSIWIPAQREETAGQRIIS